MFELDASKCQRSHYVFDLNKDIFSGLESLTFDDLLVVPGWSEMLPSAVSTSSDIAVIELKVPFMSAAMDTVTYSAETKNVDISVSIFCD